jgi:hypothetical protein
MGCIGRGVVGCGRLSGRLHHVLSGKVMAYER